jgi:hypothetical protein
MPVLMTAYVQEAFVDTAEYAQVRAVAERLLDHLNTEAAQALLLGANMPGLSSAVVQASFGGFARDVGFVDESKGLFASYENKALRPDYFLALEGTGILLEVERGKTTINNMDLLDFWKCHLCEPANYLFLMVPQELRQNPTMRPKREYNYVVKRMASFFVARNYTNVRGLHVFGY